MNRNFLLLIFLLQISMIIQPVIGAFHVFIPERNIPISVFIEKTSGTSIELAVKKEVLQGIPAESIKIACKSSDSLVYYNPTEIDVAGGKVKHNNLSANGKFVAITTVWQNDFPIVTHWDQSLNSGRGGVRYGASDGIKEQDLDANGNVVYIDNVFDTNHDSPYMYNTENYAMIADDPLARVPSYEQYIGENYSLLKVGDTQALEIADSVIKNTGYPIIFICNTGTNSDVLLTEGVPAFQHINGLLIGSGTVYSLATVILPPYWDTAPAVKYPVLFHSYYDLNEDAFRLTETRSYCKVMGNLVNAGIGSAITILYNGGGSMATYCGNLSLYTNVKLLLNAAANYLGADKHSIVASGFSRGAYGPMLYAGAPERSNAFTIRYIIAECGVFYNGQWSYNTAPATHPNLAYAAGYLNGYKFSWMSSWRDPVSGMPGRDLSLLAMFGSTNRVYADNRSAGSLEFINNMKAQGTKLILINGTHDAFKAFPQVIDFMEQARGAGFTVENYINFRTGHNITGFIGDPVITDRFILSEKILSNEFAGHGYSVTGNTFYIKRKIEREPLGEYISATPQHSPFFCEVPVLALVGEEASLTVTGQKGWDYKLAIQKINDAEWVKDPKWIGENVVREGSEIVLMQGTLPVKLGNESYVHQKMIVPEDSVSGYYIYTLYYKEHSSSTWLKVNEHQISHNIFDGGGIEDKKRYAVFQVRTFAEIGTLPTALDVRALSDNNICFGLSEY